jgi:ABC-type transporter Mla maintaining outer membrane lipid asymmetry permease subunit MlaE
VAFLTERVKAGLLEVQEYVRMLGKVGRGLVSRPFYARDTIEQFDAIGIGMVGGWVVTTLVLRVASSVYWNSIVQGLFIEDVWMGLIKPFFLGFAIVSIGCHVGLRARGGTQGVGRATTNAVVASSVSVIAVDYLVTQLLIVLMY